MSKKTLVIVESPSKVKSVQKYVGDDYIVTSSCGHVTEIPKKTLGIDLQTYTAEFIESPSKKDVIANIKKLYKSCNGILLASDGDREGCGISMHIFNILGVKPENRKRILFNEITEKAIKEAIKNPVIIDENERDSYLARVIADRLIGYTVSPTIWTQFNSYTLSAGRVMSPVIKLVIERENEIEKFNSTPYFHLDANFVLDKKELTKSSKTNTNYILTTCENNIQDQSIIENLYKKCADGTAKFIIKSISKSNGKRNPSPAYTTSTLQQDSSIKLGYSPHVTMSLAQKLFETGNISYHRTDSIAIAPDAMKSIEKYIKNKWGEKYYRYMEYKAKSTNIQGAHEACRVCDVNKESVLGVDGLNAQHNRLYQMIFRRTISSQMTPSEFDLLTVKITYENINKENNDAVNTTDDKTDITKSKKVSKKDTKKEHTDNNTLTFVGKHEKNTFLGFLECMNMHKKKVIKNALGDLEVIPEDELQESDEEQDNEDNTDNTENIPNSDYLEKIFNSLKENQEIFAQSMNTIQKYTKPIARYTEASLIKMMESINLGRPSTFSSTLTKIQEKQYVEKKNLPQKQVSIISLKYEFPDKIKIENKNTILQSDKNKLVPTSLGIMVNDFLCKNFIELMDYKYTANIELLLDDIAEGKAKIYDVIHLIYTKMKPIIDSLSQDLKARKALKSADPKADSASRRNLGLNPVNNLPVVCIKSKKGFLLIEENPVKKQSRFANFSSSFEDMTLETALTLLIFPKNLGSYLEKEIIIKKAKNIYIQYGDSNYSIENYMNTNKQIIIDPETISLTEAKKIIDYYIKCKVDKEENAKKDKVLNDDITIKTGPYGVYLKLSNNTNVKLPKKYKDNIDSLTLEDALAIVEKHNTTPSKGSKAGRFETKGSAKPKPKPKSAEVKPKAKKEKAKKETKETKPKKEKAIKPVKIKPVKTKF